MNNFRKPKVVKKLLVTVLLAMIFLGAQPAVAATSLSTAQTLRQKIQSQMDAVRAKIAEQIGSTRTTRTVSQPRTYTRQQLSDSNTTPTQVVQDPAPAPVVQASPTTTQSQPTATLPSSSSSKMWGAYTGNTASSFTSFEQLAGKQADVHAVFMGWGDSFPNDLASPLKSNGQSILIFWEQYGTSLDQIIDGSQDSYIKEFANEAKSYGGQVLLAPFHEMNGDWDPWGGTVGSNTPQKVIQAWQHMHDLFAGAGNVKFVWAVNNDSVPDTSENSIKNYYPGSSYVDYVGIDGFNFGSPWQTYDQVFSSALSQVKGYGKPILLSSMASAAGSAKAAWISDALLKIYSDSSIKGFIWFNENKEENWLINSDSASLQAFKDGIK